MRQARRVAGALLAIGGAGALADAVTTVVWQEPLGALEAQGTQRELGGEYAALVGRYSLGGFQPVAAAGSRPVEPAEAQHQAMLRRAHVAGVLDRRAPAGQPLGRLVIPRIGLTKLWVQGTDTRSLTKGPGHYPGTVLPGRRGTVGIAGHRTTHGAPFRDVNRLRPGDRIELSMPYGQYTYAVQGTRIVSPKQAEVLRPVRSDRLVLTACHPLWSARQRIVISAKLVRWPGMRQGVLPLRHPAPASQSSQPRAKPLPRFLRGAPRLDL